MSTKAFGTGAAQAVGSNLANAILQTPQGQQAVQATAATIVQGGAAAIGTAVMVGQAAIAAEAAVATAAGMAIVAAAPVVVSGAVVVGVIVAAEKLWEWLDS